MINTKIAFIASWEKSPKKLLKDYSKLTPHNSGVWKNLIGVNDTNSADYIICLDDPSIEHSKVIHFRREPDFIKKWTTPNLCHQSFDYSSKDKYHACTRSPRSYSELQNENFRSKLKQISVVSSNKHRHRTSFIKKITKNTKLDYFGNIFTGHSVSLQERSRAFDGYSTSVCIENCAQENYFTEKITDCLLSWCTPLYWGCPNINDFFPEDSYRLIDLNNPQQLFEIAKAPMSKKNIDAMREARNLILNKYNIWPTIHNIIS